MSVSISKLAKLVDGQLVQPFSNTVELKITSASTLETATGCAITLVDSVERLPSLTQSNAAAAIVPTGAGPQDRPTIEVSDVHQAFAIIILHFRPQRTQRRLGVSPQAAIDPSARLAGNVEVLPLAFVGPDVELAEGVVLHPGVRIGAGCKIGAGTTIFSNAVLYDDTVVGKDCIIHSNAVLGAYGFGYKPDSAGLKLSSQLGWVELGDHVEVGAGTTIDRGTYGPTIIGSGTKIDNLVMIAHNCRIGQHNMICSQVGVAGSTSTGEWVIMAGQCGLRDHIHIGDGAVLGARSGVSNDVPAKQTVLGEPAIDLKQRKLQLASMSKLPEMRKQVKRLLKRVEELEQGSRASTDESSSKAA
ncbi:MAG: UDP-3-O-(3-hydroxymyristoyl)glucosamine N-acyltransferase [Planctomycetaceae bacterium]|nr:UDP-3-O-(3-hydroxymyristoyl)glucosamine N-acyltransferase [Planctomycetaceae bacterium]